MFGTTRWRVPGTSEVLAKRDGGRLVSQAFWPGSWKIGRVARSHRCLGSHIGAHDSVIARRASNRPNPHDAMAIHSVLEQRRCVIT